MFLWQCSIYPSSNYGSTIALNGWLEKSHLLLSGVAVTIFSFKLHCSDYMLLAVNSSYATFIIYYLLSVCNGQRGDFCQVLNEREKKLSLRVGKTLPNIRRWFGQRRHEAGLYGANEETEKSDFM